MYAINPLREVRRIQDELDEVFRRMLPTASPAASDSPAVNVWSDDEGAVVTAELPGVDLSDVDVSVEGGVLTIRGERRAHELPPDVRVWRRERHDGPFRRSLRLPFRVDAEAVEATYERGVLRVRLPRTEADRPRRIPVQEAPAEGRTIESGSGRRQESDESR